MREKRGRYVPDCKVDAYTNISTFAIDEVSLCFISRRTGRPRKCIYIDGALKRVVVFVRPLL